MSKCDYCPSLFHSSNQCKLNPKSLKKTPSEAISGNKVEDYLMFSDKVNETMVKKSVSPFSFSIDSLAGKRDASNQFFIDRGDRAVNVGQEERPNNRENGNDSRQRRVDDKQNDQPLGQSNTQSARSFSVHRNYDAEQRNYNGRNFDQSRSSPSRGTFRNNDYYKHNHSNNDNHARESWMSRDYNSRNHNFHAKFSNSNGKYTDRSENLDLSFTIRNDHGHNNDSGVVQQQITNPSRFNERIGYSPKRIHVAEASNLHSTPANLEVNSNDNNPKRLKTKDDVVSGQSRDNLEYNGNEVASQAVSSIFQTSTAIKIPFLSDEDEIRINRTVSNSSSPPQKSDRFSDKPPSPVVLVNDTIAEVSGAHSTPVANNQSEHLTPSQSAEKSLETQNSDKLPNHPMTIEVMINDQASPSTSYISSRSELARKSPEKERSNSPDIDGKKLSYHHLKFETKRRNAYAELDASISLEISKMNSSISELEVFMFEKALHLLDDSVTILDRLKSQKDCFKRLKDSYLHQLYEIEDQESNFFREKVELRSDSNGAPSNTSKPQSSEHDSPEKQNTSIQLNSSPLSKKEKINQEYVPSILGELKEIYPPNPLNEPNVFSSSNGLVSVSSILDGKPRSVLFPHEGVGESLDGLLFSTTIENKLQVWDIDSFSPLKTIAFNGEREKNEKLTLPEDLCWVSPNSVLISSKGTEKVKEQEWNNLTLLYDLRRSVKPGGFKYKILNFREHGHGAISAIKGISNDGKNMTRWVTGGYNNKVYVWSIGDLSADTTLDSKLLFDDHTSTVTALYFCPKKKLIYSGGIDGKIFGYTVDGKIQSSFSMKPRKIRDIFQIGSNPSNLLISTSDRESEFLIYDSVKNAPVMQFGSRKELTTADDKFERVRSMYQHAAVHPNGYLICMGDHNTSKVNMWDIRKPNISLQFDVHDKGHTDKGKSKYHSLVLGFHSSKEKQYLYSLGSDKRIVRIDLGSIF